MSFNVQGNSKVPMNKPKRSVPYDPSKMIMIEGDIYELDTKQKSSWGPVLENIRAGNGGKLLKSWFLKFPKETSVQSPKGSLSPAPKESLIFTPFENGKFSGKIYHSINYVTNQELQQNPELQHLLRDVHHTGHVSSLLGEGSYGLVRLIADYDTGELKAIKKVAAQQFTPNESRYQNSAADKGLALPTDLSVSYQGKKGPIVATPMELVFGDMKSASSTKYSDFNVIMVHYYKRLGGIDKNTGKQMDGAHFITQKDIRALSTNYKSRLEIALRIVTLVEELHKLEIAHCDLKPRNILIQQDGEIVLGDFGLSKKLDEPTLGYGSPIYRSTDTSILGEQADLYSLGVILQTLLSTPNAERYNGFFNVLKPAGKEITKAMEASQSITPQGLVDGTSDLATIKRQIEAALVNF